MKLQVLMSTMNRQKEDILNLVRQSQLQSDVVLINQCGRNSRYKLDNEQYNIEVIEYDEKGLSKSRNKAMLNSDANICLIADDDMLYDVDLEKNILEAFEANPNYDIIAFYIERSASFNGKKLGSRKEIHKVSSLELMSVQIAFRRLNIRFKDIRFDQDFGAGSGHFISGEENIFLMDCLRNGLRIVYLPIKIGATQENESTWFTGYNDLYFRSKGATFERLFPLFALPMIYIFAFLKRNLYRDESSWNLVVSNMKQGRKECKEMMKERLK